jgi:hypothetical protein
VCLLAAEVLPGVPSILLELLAKMREMVHQFSEVKRADRKTVLARMGRLLDLGACFLGQSNSRVTRSVAQNMVANFGALLSGKREIRCFAQSPAKHLDFSNFCDMCIQAFLSIAHDHNSVELDLGYVEDVCRMLSCCSPGTVNAKAQRGYFYTFSSATQFPYKATNQKNNFCLRSGDKDAMYYVAHAVFGPTNWGRCLTNIFLYDDETCQFLAHDAEKSLMFMLERSGNPESAIEDDAFMQVVLGQGIFLYEREVCVELLSAVMILELASLLFRPHPQIRQVLQCACTLSS